MDSKFGSLLNKKMVNNMKIKKYLKIINIVILCIAINIPANAAISISDGSAFTTKTEFLVDVNNLSSRIARLEIGIDGTLDDKVNSYIDQKGFWKPSNPVLKTAELTNIAPTNLNANSTRGNVDIAEMEIVESFDKTGMCLLKFSTIASNVTTTTKKFNWGYKGTKASNYYNNNLVLYAMFYEEYNSIKTLKSTIVLGSGTGQMYVEEANSNNFILAIPLSDVKIIYPTMFFVNKGAKLTMKLHEAYGLIQISNDTLTALGTNGNLLNVKIEELELY